MDETAADAQRLFELAKAGDRDALGKLLDYLRPELRRKAQARIDSRIRVRVDASDIAQQSCLSALRDFDRFEGDELAQFVAWLRQIHAQNLRDALRDHGRYEKRAVSKEVADGHELQPLDGRIPSPSRQAIREEWKTRLGDLLQTLPESQREVLQLRYLEEMSLADIAQRLGLTKGAAAGLLKRGLANLRQRLTGQSEG